jgi:sarcosine oxidase subunit beta
MKKAEIVIIGGGVVGASVAFHLTERGAPDVLILEREPAQGLGSTGKATGGVRAQFETEINIRMSLYSLDFFRNWEFDCGYEPRGYLFLGTDDRQLDYLKRNVETQKSLGVKDVEIVDCAAIKEICPILNCEDITGGSFGKNDGFINPLAVMRGFTSKALERGARIEFDTKAFSVETVGGKVTAVATNKGRIECEKVVICTGAWARFLAKTAGVCLPVEPQKRQIVWAQSRNRLPENLPMVIDLGSGFHFRPARDFVDSSANADNREVLFAYPDPEELASFDTDFDAAFIEKVYARARHRAPFLFETVPVREKCRAGLYENTPDHHAILGGCETEGLYFANGFSGHGVMHSPATGRALSEIIVDGEASFLDVSCLRLERFAKGALLHETAFI